MSDSLSKNSSPSIKTGSLWEKPMFDMEIALLPVVLFAAYNFGMDAIKVIFISVLSCVGTEWIYEVCLKKKVQIADGTAVVTGLLLGLTLPAGVDLYIPVLGGIFATLVVVLLYGGYGQHFMIPSLAARSFLYISFGSQMSTYTIDGVSCATPLATLATGSIPDLKSIFLGTVNGSIGEVSALAILIGFVFLMVRKGCKMITPLVYTAVFAVYIGIFGGHGFNLYYIAGHILAGGFLFTACFLASDLVVSPKTVKGEIVYGILLGVLTGIYRTLGSTAENVSYAVITANLFLPLIDKFLPEKAKEVA